MLHSFSKAPPAVCPWQPQVIQASPRMLPGRDAGSTRQASRKPGTWGTRRVWHGTKPDENSVRTVQKHAATSYGGSRRDTDTPAELRFC